MSKNISKNNTIITDRPSTTDTSSRQSTTNTSSGQSTMDTQLIMQYIDDKIKELKLEIIKYVDEKFKRKECEGKELVLSDQSRKEVRAEINQIIKRDIAPAIKKAVAFVDYRTSDGETMINRYRMQEHANNKRRLTDGGKTCGAENSLQASLFVFDGDDT